MKEFGKKTGLYALAELQHSVIDHYYLNNGNNPTYREDVEIIAKELKALEIIKKKQISIWRFRNRVFGYEQKQNGNNVNDTYEYYTNCFGYYHEGFEFELLTEEEFELLKEVLK